MVMYLARRLLVSVPVLLLIGIFSFSLVHFMPGDAASTIAGESASAEQIEAIREEMGLNESLLTQFSVWVGNVLTGDLGTSYAYGTPVVSLITQSLEVTVSLVLLGFLVAAFAGALLGTAAGMSYGKRLDSILSWFMGLLLAVPTYWIAMLLIIVFVFYVGLFNSTGYTSISSDFVGWLHSLALPVMAIAATSTADIARQVRSSVHDVAGNDFILSAKAYGLTRRSIAFKHIGRNVGIPVITISGVQIERLIGAAVVIEAIFALPGFGNLMITAVLQQDMPVVQAAVLIVGATVVVINTLTDMSYALINPSVRRRGRL